MKSGCPHDEENKAELVELEKILDNFSDKGLPFLDPGDYRILILPVIYDKLLHSLMKWKNVGRLSLD